MAKYFSNHPDIMDIWDRDNRYLNKWLDTLSDVQSEIGYPLTIVRAHSEKFTVYGIRPGVDDDPPGEPWEWNEQKQSYAPNDTEDGRKLAEMLQALTFTWTALPGIPRVWWGEDEDGNQLEYRPTFMEKDDGIVVSYATEVTVDETLWSPAGN